MSLITLAKYLIYSSVVVWIFPAIRQWKGRLFYYFLILAIIDPVSYIHLILLNTNIPFKFNIIASLFLLFSITWKIFSNKLNKIILLFLSAFIIFLFLLFDLSVKGNILVLILIYSIVFLVFLKDLIVEYVNTSTINLFYMMLVFYQLTMISKFLNLIIGFADATAFFIITSIAQIFFGLFFSIFREDNPRLIL